MAGVRTIGRINGSHLALGFLAVALSIFLAAQVFAQKPQATAKKSAEAQAATSNITPPSTHELTTDDVGAFLDGLVPAQLARQDIAGAVVSIVKDGKVIFAKGYGFADVASRKPVSPSDTLFRPGSISKLFTWTSVMQLVEQGKLDLDRDVNDYIDFKIPAAFGKPITLRNIMTHTPGFEETAKELFVPTNAEMRPLDEYLKDHTPARIFPPGTVPAYSNYATAVAGYIVQRTSGKPFDQYAADNIINPLGMHHTTFVQPLPADLQPLMSGGYMVASQPVRSYEFVQAYPAGSVATSGLDMCNFMIAHLQDGQFGSVQILKPETAKLMHARQWGYDPRLNHMALGFYEESRNGLRIIGHGGDTIYFHSQLHLILEKNVGFFISVNSAGKGEGGTDLFQKFMDRYFPYTPPPGEKVANAQADAQRVAGLYLSSRRSETSFLKLLNVVSQGKVSVNDDGTISVSLLLNPNGEMKKLEEIAPLLYREVHGQAQLGFQLDQNGNMVMAIDYPFFVFQRPSLADNKSFNLAIIIPSLLIIVLTLVLWPFGAGIRKHYARPLQMTQTQKRMRIFVRLVCIFDLIVVITWLIIISSSNSPGALNRSMDKEIIFVMLLGVIAAIATLIPLLNAVRNWGQKELWIWARLHDVVLAVACVGFTWFLWHWNLMNFNMHY